MALCCDMSYVAVFLLGYGDSVDQLQVLLPQSSTLHVVRSPRCCQKELLKCKSDHITLCPQFPMAPSSLQHILSITASPVRPLCLCFCLPYWLITHHFLSLSPTRLLVLPGTLLLHLLLCTPETLTAKLVIKDTCLLLPSP